MSDYQKKENGNCKNCDKKINGKISTATYCSNSCMKNFRKNLRKSMNPILDINRNKIGAISELIACSDLLKNGFDVFRSVSPSASCDIIIFYNKKVFRVEVTTGYKSENGKNCFSKKNKEKFEILCVVFKNGEIFYSPSLQEIKDQK